ncbi:GNAT family N-acetyltransferase [Sphingobacterium bambusae]|uniref:GNAT family N-acetyltransferase n=1 Tax=Sphingobacterium bambusae TaxID=662858 RepID=A0ABW6BDJ9_9SPHI
MSGIVTYIDIPVAVIGLLAVHVNHRDNKLGQILLIDALRRMIGISAVVGNHTVILGPINESAKNFYSKFGFI